LLKPVFDYTPRAQNVVPFDLLNDISQATTLHSIQISSCKLRAMALRRTRTENLALTMLARDGIAAIWTLHVAAAKAYLDGNKGMAATILEIPDAAESEWLRRAKPLPL
jgi:hypothetical protein